MGSEFDFIQSIRRRSDKKNRRVAGLTHGIGDDCAVLKRSAGYETVITTDLLVEGVDFARQWMKDSFLGYKALAVSLSDIAAMGARPRFALLSIGVPEDIWHSDFLHSFYNGFFSLADAHKVALIGGDVSRTPEHIVVDSIVIGEAKRGQAVTRAYAHPGDLIYVTGTLGGASCGLKLLLAGAKSPDPINYDSTKTNKLLFRQLCPMPRVAWGRQLGAKKLATAMIDLSDGLSSDLHHLCEESDVGADIEAARVPVDPLIAQVRQTKTTQETLDMALHGGEDYELLFTVRPRNAARLPKKIGGISVSQIGVVTNKSGRVRLFENGRSRLLRPEGFVHFKTAQ